MTRRFLIVALLGAIPSALSAQKVIDLTGKPASTIAEPFTKISGAHELSPTLAVATDNMEAKVVLVDFARGSVKQLGSKGRGPNEYQYPSPPIPAPGGAYVFDTYQRRAIVVDAQGRVAGMKTLPDVSALSRVRGSDAAGRFYFEGSEYDPNTGSFSDSLPVVRWDPASNKVDRVAKVWGGGRVRYQRGGSGGSAAREITPFPHLDAWVALTDGSLALLRHEPFRIDYMSAAGALKAGAPMPVTPIPVTARERAWYRERNTPQQMTAGGGGGQRRPGMEWDDALFPLTLPPFIASEVVASPDGAVWVPRSFTGADKIRRYDIYDAAGKLVAVANVKANAKVVGFGPKSVYVATTSPDDDLVYLEKHVLTR